MGSTLRSAYAWLLLSVIALAMFPAALLVQLLTAPFDGRRDWLRLFTASWISLYGALTPLYRFRIEGREHLPHGRPYVLVSNHESGLDVLILLMLRTPARFLAEDWIFRVPLAGRLLRACRHIPVRPGDRESGRRALADAERALFEGSPVAIFPEGRLSPDGMGDFRPGAFVLARRAGVPVVPVRIEGAGRAWRPGTLVVEGCHEIRIQVLPPVSAEEVAAVEVDGLRRCVREAIASA